MLSFKNIDTFSKKIKKVKKENWVDWFKIGKNWFTIEEYDSSGKEMVFVSITARKTIVINTENRYSDKWLKDAEIEEYETETYRFSPDYYIEKADFNKLKKENKRELLKYIGKTWGTDELVDFLHSLDLI